MEFRELQKIGKLLKRLYYSVRSDPAALLETRQLLLGIIVCFVIFYGMSAFFLEPKEKVLTQKKAELVETKDLAPDQISTAIATRIYQLEKQKQILDEKINTLKVKEAFLTEHWNSLGDPEQFVNTIFTLNSAAPVSLEKNLEQMARIQTRSRNNFELHPVTLMGEANFFDLYAYLQYIEKKSEVGAINNLDISGMPVSELQQNGNVHFSIVVSRLTLKRTT